MLAHEEAMGQSGGSKVRQCVLTAHKALSGSGRAPLPISSLKRDSLTHTHLEKYLFWQKCPMGQQLFLQDGSHLGWSRQSKKKKKKDSLMGDYEHDSVLTSRIWGQAKHYLTKRGRTFLLILYLQEFDS